MKKDKQDRCDRCGRFFKYSDVHIYTPYGGYLDNEPPDDKIICNKCWKQMTEKEKELTEKIAWQKNW